jgi:ribosomal-protein-alanine N-acetyltransferase
MTPSSAIRLADVRLQTGRLVLAPPDAGDAVPLLDYYRRNRSHFRPWEPRRDESFHTVEGMAARIAAQQDAMYRQQALHLLLRAADAGTIVGECGFTNIVRGPFQACHLGFSLCRDAEGRGLMYEALQCALCFVFTKLGLHRVMANYRPENARSARLLDRLGFEREGLARAYLHIDGQWRDHVLTSLLADDTRRTPTRIA